MSRQRTFAGTGTHCSVAGLFIMSGMGARRIKAWRAGNTVARHQRLRFRIFHLNHRSEALELVFLRHNWFSLGELMKFDAKFPNSKLSGSHASREMTNSCAELGGHIEAKDTKLDHRGEQVPYAPVVSDLTILHAHSVDRLEMNLPASGREAEKRPPCGSRSRS
jgi:hypothetical protein